MHEWSLAKNLLQQVDQICQLHGAARAGKVRVEVGELAGVEPECLRSAFALLQQEGANREAILELQKVPLQVFCRQCQQQSTLASFHFVCPGCGSKQVSIVAGEHMVLKEVVLEFTEAS